jgi:hypothetical protein
MSSALLVMVAFLLPPGIASGTLRAPEILAWSHQPLVFFGSASFVERIHIQILPSHRI